MTDERFAEFWARVRERDRAAYRLVASGWIMAAGVFEPNSAFPQADEHSATAFGLQCRPIPSEFILRASIHINWEGGRSGRQLRQRAMRIGDCEVGVGGDK